jgi:hypothetical protein
LQATKATQVSDLDEWQIFEEFVKLSATVVRHVVQGQDLGHRLGAGHAEAALGALGLALDALGELLKHV